MDSNCPDALTETHFPMILSKTRASKIRMWAALGLQCSGGPSLMVSLAVPLSFSLSSLSFRAAVEKLNLKCVDYGPLTRSEPSVGFSLLQCVAIQKFENPNSDTSLGALPKQ